MGVQEHRYTPEDTVDCRGHSWTSWERVGLQRIQWDSRGHSRTPGGQRGPPEHTEGPRETQWDSKGHSGTTGNTVGFQGSKWHYREQSEIPGFKGGLQGHSGTSGDTVGPQGTQWNLRGTQRDPREHSGTSGYTVGPQGTQWGPQGVQSDPGNPETKAEDRSVLVTKCNFKKHKTAAERNKPYPGECRGTRCNLRVHYYLLKPRGSLLEPNLATRTSVLNKTLSDQEMTRRLSARQTAVKKHYRINCSFVVQETSPSLAHC